MPPAYTMPFLCVRLIKHCLYSSRLKRPAHPSHAPEKQTTPAVQQTTYTQPRWFHAYKQLLRLPDNGLLTAIISPAYAASACMRAP